MATRRAFLQTASAAGAALSVGFRLEAGKHRTGEPLRPNAWVRVGQDGRLTVTVGKSEMGQGVRTSLPMIAAEELGIEWAMVDLVQAQPGPDFQRLGTGGSYSIQSLWLPLRQAAAAAREMLLRAAAENWRVEPGTCSVAKGEVLHAASGRRLAYGSLVPAAAKLPVPADPPLKKTADYSLVGHATLRYDGPRILDGSAQYALDLRIPDMKIAVMARCPVFGGKAKAWDDAKAKALPGVRAVLAVAGGVAVVADSTAQALDGLDALTITWEPGPQPAFSSEGFRALLEERLARPGATAREEGDAAKAGAGRRLEARYEFPWQAHVTLEPPSCIAFATREACHLWVGSQSPNDVQTRVAKLLDLPKDRVQVHLPLIGGGFGRRLRSDFALEAAELSRAIQGPVQLVWTRQEDIQHDLYHPMSLHRLEAGLEGGALGDWLHRVAAPSIALSWAEGKRSPSLVHTEMNGAADTPYRSGHLKVEYAEVECPVPLGWWRGIQAVPNVYARECFLDEVAAALGRDPLALRLELLGPDRVLDLDGERIDIARLRGVLQLAAAKADWGKPLPAGHGRGIACCAYEGRSYVAHVAEVSLRKDGTLKVHRIVAAADCGLVVNPIGAQAQVEGGIIWGLSALRTQITFKDGRTEQSSYGDLPVCRMADAPAIEVHLVASQASPTGLGEPPVPPTLPAVLNAAFAATGKRVRRLPWQPELFV